MGSNISRSYKVSVFGLNNHAEKRKRERQDQEIDSRVLIQNALSAINERKHSDFGRFTGDPTYPIPNIVFSWPILNKQTNAF